MSNMNMQLGSDMHRPVCLHIFYLPWDTSSACDVSDCRNAAELLGDNQIREVASPFEISSIVFLSHPNHILNDIAR